MRRFSLQLLALAPIPVVVALVVWAGNRPPPGGGVVLNLSGGAVKATRPGERPAATLPVTPRPGWKLQATPIRYDEKSLFDRIDGAAPVYIRAGFVYSLGADYKKEGAKDPVVVDVYDMGTTNRALGMYATERDRSYTFIEVGDEGYLASGSLNFWRGRCYVKMAGYEQGEAADKELIELARGLAAALPAPLAAERTAELAALSLLPTEERAPHGAGYSHPPLGDVDGLQEVHFAEYTAGEKRYRLFVAREATPAAAAARFAKAKGYFQKDKAQLAESSEGAVQVITVRGAESASLLVLADRVVAGGIDLPDPTLLDTAKTWLVQSLSKGAAATPPEKKP